jgi:hypothetical protein
MKAHRDILHLVESTPFVDTHEHLWEEQHRVEALKKDSEHHIWSPDIAMLLGHYVDSDLIVAGMPAEYMDKIKDWGLGPKEKWALVEPYYQRSRNTGYLRCLRESVRRLYGERDITADNVEKISGLIRDGVHPGFYETILCDVAHIEYCHVNSLEADPFMQTADPELLAQDLSFVAFSEARQIGDFGESAGREVGTLDDWHAVIDWHFEQYGPRAIALKSQQAYGRRLDFAEVSAEDAAPLFKRYRKDRDSVDGAESKAIRDHLFHYCMEKAAEYSLVVKLHTGYYAGQGGMPMDRVAANAGDVCGLLKAHPKVRFDFFHIGYPCQDDFIAVAKHYPNAYLDMCWAWIINPAASVRFLKEFLMAVPANKIFTFGGDFMPVEMVPGHAAVARQGIAQAITELVEEGWMDESDVPGIVDRIMRGNAHEVFDQPGKLAAWRAAGTAVSK